jgi:exopolysaccharide biosynthesis polyprenyl glycosylphosphotransferase
MLYRYSEIFRTGMMVTDLLLITFSWLGAYWLRFYSGLIESPQGIPEFMPYLESLILILPVSWWILRGRGLYESRRTGALYLEVAHIVGATTIGLMALISVSFFVRDFSYSRAVVAIFYGASIASVTLGRMVVRGTLRGLRRKGINQRFAIVVGAGRLAEEVIERIHRHPETGLQVIGVFSGGEAPPLVIAGVPVVGRCSDIKPFLRTSSRIDELIFALPREEWSQFDKTLADLDDETVSVRIVPDFLNMLTLRSCVDDLDGLPMISLREGPLMGWAAVEKRVFDVTVSLALVPLVAPLMLLIAGGVLSSSGSPVLYRQKRMGLDGKVFDMLKFRTMKTGAENSSGPVWAEEEDPRRTRLGSFLRRTSLDELPQLWNVLRGDMSLVGPRPERPFFIEQFRGEIPGYMLRYKIKAGVTGWAQVHGWRGNTSIHERVEHDIHYIQNWSLALDVRILVMTLWRGLVHRNAY